METRIALLRAVNVGGTTKVAMADLRDLFTALGFESPRTLLQTGNVVFQGSEPSDQQLERLLEQETERRLGLRTAYFIRSAAEWTTAIERNPFPDEAERDPSHLLLIPLKDAPEAATLAVLRAAIAGREAVELVGRHLFAYYPDGIGRSKLTIKLIESTLGTQGTGRNWNTVLKLAELVRG